MMSYLSEIRDTAIARGVFLFHFTQIENISGIVQHGLLSRRILAGPQYHAYGSDEYRLDGDDDAVSVSISRVNMAMFRSKRNKQRRSRWVLLVLDPEILWTHSCRFCWTNAGRREIKSKRGFRGGPWAFSKMFDGDAQERSGLEPWHPTDPEAEVQVLEAIAPQYIIAAIVESEGLVDYVQTTLNLLKGEPRPVFIDIDWAVTCSSQWRLS